ncbi:MAG: cell wall hydrolase [Clostridia bacterium]|nr:cell wall hydrolase [Clostridia bacterium]
MKIIHPKRKYMRTIYAVGVTAAMLFAGALSVSAEALAATDEPAVLYTAAAVYEGQATVEKRLGVGVTVNGAAYQGTAFLYNETTYIGIRQFSMLLGANSVEWEAESKTATVEAETLSLSARYGSNYLIANGRYLWIENGVIIENGTMYVPIRVLCQAFGYGVVWDDSTKTAVVNKTGGPIVSGAYYYDADSVYWLSRIINAEATGESLRGKIAVGNVVLNRKNSTLFPNTIYGVIFDTKNGVQFTPIANGAIYNIPTEESIIAAKLCLEGVNLLPHALFFVNEKIATSSWVTDNREYIAAIGNHKFFA